MESKTLLLRRVAEALDSISAPRRSTVESRVAGWALLAHFVSTQRISVPREASIFSVLLDFLARAESGAASSKEVAGAVRLVVVAISVGPPMPLTPGFWELAPGYVIRLATCTIARVAEAAEDPTANGADDDDVALATLLLHAIVVLDALLSGGLMHDNKAARDVLLECRGLVAFDGVGLPKISGELLRCLAVLQGGWEEPTPVAASDATVANSSAEDASAAAFAMWQREQVSRVRDARALEDVLWSLAIRIETDTRENAPAEVLAALAVAEKRAPMMTGSGIAGQTRLAGVLQTVADVVRNGRLPPPQHRHFGGALRSAKDRLTDISARTVLQQEVLRALRMVIPSECYYAVMAKSGLIGAYFQASVAMNMDTAEYCARRYEVPKVIEQRRREGRELRMRFRMAARDEKRHADSS